VPQAADFFERAFGEDLIVLVIECYTLVMKTARKKAVTEPRGNNEADLWQRVMHFEEPLSQEAARALLKISFAPSDIERASELAGKARAGALSEAEEREAQAYERLGCMLDVLHSQARRVLKRRRKAS